MIEKESFTRSIETELNVAQIGINREDWYCHRPGVERDHIIKTMLREGFEVVPVMNKKGEFLQYFTLSENDKTKLSVNKIKAEDRLYYLTHVRDAVWKMKAENRTHYFLSNGKNENDIVGLLSLSNFNCREFYVFIFTLLSYVEREFAILIESNEKNAFEILAKESKTKDLQNQLLGIKERINSDKEKNNENNYKEYLYLHHLIWLVVEEKGYQKLGYKDAEVFRKGTSGLKHLRNNIAHPVRSLVRSTEDLEKLHIGLSKLYEFKGCLDKNLK